ncbi:MAG: hypothetical protein IPG69_11455 [Flavobacteriales bacterium]|nr:hypothetical protein [Flavobacteriales bacterium]
MRHLLLALLLLPIAASTSAQDEPGGTPLNAMVTVQISDLDAALWPKVNARIAREQNMNVEYSCLTTGIIVLRMRNIKVAERSDVIILVKRILREAGVKGTIEFLNVHVEEGDGNKCFLPRARSPLVAG